MGWKVGNLGRAGQGRAGQGRAGQGRAGQATKREISDFLLGLIISHLLMAKSFLLNCSFEH
jgi:hypothetical protein